MFENITALPSVLLTKFRSLFKSSDNELLKAPIETDAVELQNVCFSFAGSEVLKDISLSLNERRIGVIGLNGSGKSTLVRLLNGLNQPVSGEVSVFGLNTQVHQRLIPRLVGFIFQNPDHQIIFPTVLEELAFGLEQLGRNTADSRQGAREFLAKFGVSHLAERAVQNLSEGQKQLVCILAALIMKPRLLLLDEPFSSLDLAKRKALQKVLNSQCERLIMVSHDLEMLIEFDRLVWIEDGRVKADGAPADVILRYKAYVENIEHSMLMSDL